MLRLIPAGLHRLALRVAWRARQRWRRFARPDIRGVGVLVRDEAGRVLLVRHSYGPQGWAVPGGGLGGAEDPAEGARREMQEELSLSLKELRLLDERVETMAGCSHTGYLFHALGEGDPQADGREICEARWFALSDLDTIPLTRITERRLTEQGLKGT